MNFKTFCLVAFLFAAGGFLAMHIDNGDHSQDHTRPSYAKFPEQKRANDKIILVGNAPYDNVKQTVTEFFNNYNQRRQQNSVELRQLAGNRTAIQFPYDIPFNTFLYFVSTLHDPKSGLTGAEVMAWDVPMPNDPWTRPEMARKVAMIYLPQGSQEKGIMYLTTSDGIGFKMGFAFKSQTEKLDQPVSPYQAPDVTLSDLRAAPMEEIY